MAKKKKKKRRTERIYFHAAAVHKMARGRHTKRRRRGVASRANYFGISLVGALKLKYQRGVNTPVDSKALVY